MPNWLFKQGAFKGMMTQFSAPETSLLLYALECKVILGETIKTSADEVPRNLPPLPLQLQTASLRPLGFHNLPAFSYPHKSSNGKRHVQTRSCHRKRSRPIAFTLLLESNSPRAGRGRRLLLGSNHLTVRTERFHPPG